MGISVDTQMGLRKPGLATGVRMMRAGEALETVHSKVSKIGLLNTSPASELMQLDLLQDGRVTLVPGERIVESFFLISGRLRCEMTTGSQVLHPGDLVTTNDLSESVLLIALSDAKLLYLTSEPQFHLLSDRLAELRRLAIEVESKDGYTADHCERLQSLSYATARELGLSPARSGLLDYGAYLHDVGKIHVPLSILNKPGKLTSEEWTVIKKHPTYGRELIDSTFMREAGPIIEQHHERFDGSGYPFGLSRDEITIEASIIAVADTFDAMTTKRPYSPARTEYEAITELRKYAGIHYPKEVVSAFCSSLKTATDQLLSV